MKRLLSIVAVCLVLGAIAGISLTLWRKRRA